MWWRNLRVADSSIEAKEKSEKKGRVRASLSMFPSAIRGSLIMSVSLFIVYEAEYVWELVCSLRASKAEAASAAGDPRAAKQLEDLSSRKSARSEFLRLVERAIPVTLL
jgi:hypothetical protein